MLTGKPGRRFLNEMMAHLDAGGDPNPGKSFKTADGYALGKMLGKYRIGEMVLTEDEWSQLEARGVLRKLDKARFISEMRAHIQAGGDPNPGTKELSVVSSYTLGKQLGYARRGQRVLTDAQWDELEALGTWREPT